MTKILLVAAALIACTSAVAQQGGSGAAEFTFEDFIKQGYRVKQDPKQSVAQQGSKPATIEDLKKQGLRYEPAAPAKGGVDLAAGEKLIANLEQPEAPPKRELGPIDRWRYDSCRTEASKAPTKEGVYAGLRVCHEKFGQ